MNMRLGVVASDRTEMSKSIFAGLIVDGAASGALRSAGPAVFSAELAALVDGVGLQMYGESKRWTYERPIDNWRAKPLFAAGWLTLPRRDYTIAFVGRTFGRLSTRSVVQ